MELNAEQIKKALECCVDGDCYPCPYAEIGAGCRDRMAEYALALINSQEQRIKELTEQAYRLECDLQLNADEKAVAKAIEQTKKATVRKMQEKLKEALKHYPQRCGDCFKEKVDQIAKEMLEGENEN